MGIVVKKVKRMNNDKFAEFQDDFPLLIETGFIAIKQLDGISAKRLFDAAAILRPKDTSSKIGLGYIALNKMELKEATKIFQEVMKAEPDNYKACMFYGMCLILTPGLVKKGEEVIEETLKKANDPVEKNLGEVLLKLAASVRAKQSSAPFFSQSAASGGR